MSPGSPPTAGSGSPCEDGDPCRGVPTASTRRCLHRGTRVEPSHSGAASQSRSPSGVSQRLATRRAEITPGSLREHLMFSSFPWKKWVKMPFTSECKREFIDAGRRKGQGVMYFTLGRFYCFGLFMSNTRLLCPLTFLFSTTFRILKVVAKTEIRDYMTQFWDDFVLVTGNEKFAVPLHTGAAR